MVHFFSKVDKMNNDVDVVQQCFSNFKRGDKFKRLRNDYGFIVHDIFIVCRVYDKFCLQFQYSFSLSVLVSCLSFSLSVRFIVLCFIFYLCGEISICRRLTNGPDLRQNIGSKSFSVGLVHSISVKVEHLEP